MDTEYTQAHRYIHGHIHTERCGHTYKHRTYTHIFKWMHAYVHISMQGRMNRQAYMCANTGINIYIWNKWICKYKHICVHTHTYVYMYQYIETKAHMCLHIHLCLSTHIYICICIHMEIIMCCGITFLYTVKICLHQGIFLLV